MPVWLQYLIAFVALAVLIAPLAWAGRRLGGKAKGGLMLASIMLGFGEAFDPPVKRAMEATEQERDKGPAGKGEPPLE